MNSDSATLLNTAHTVRCAVELASVLTAATILATFTLTVSEMTYNVSSETLNHTQPNPTYGIKIDTLLFCIAGSISESSE